MLRNWIHNEPGVNGKQCSTVVEHNAPHEKTLRRPLTLSIYMSQQGTTFFHLSSFVKPSSYCWAYYDIKILKKKVQCRIVRSRTKNRVKGCQGFFYLRNQQSKKTPREDIVILTTQLGRNDTHPISKYSTVHPLIVLWYAVDTRAVIYLRNPAGKEFPFLEHLELKISSQPCGLQLPVRRSASLSAGQ